MKKSMIAFVLVCTMLMSVLAWLLPTEATPWHLYC